MTKYLENPIHFSADCVQEEGRCTITRENVFFLDDGDEVAAVDRLEMRCGRIVVIPDASNRGRAFLYHTSCDRMTDAVNQMLPGCLGAPVDFPQPASELTVGGLYRRQVNVPYGECRTLVERFDFRDSPE